MAIIISDPALVEKFLVASETIELRDSDGDYLRTFAPPVGKPPPGFVLPISAEELNRRKTIRVGKPLSEILDRLQESR